MRIHQTLAASKKSLCSLFTIAAIVTTLSVNVYAHGEGKHTLSVDDARVNPTVTGIRVSAAYFDINNTSDDEIRLVKISSDLSSRTELHEHTMTSGLMKMQEVKDGITIPANQSISLQSSGYHVMLMNLEAAIKPGDEIKFILSFNNGKEKVITARANLFMAHNSKPMDHNKHSEKIKSHHTHH